MLGLLLKHLHYKQPLSILSSLVENSGLCPKMGAYFSSWKQAGVNHIYDLLYKGEFMTFDKIVSFSYYAKILLEIFTN